VGKNESEMTNLTNVSIKNSTDPMEAVSWHHQNTWFAFSSFIVFCERVHPVPLATHFFQREELKELDSAP